MTQHTYPLNLTTQFIGGGPQMQQAGRRGPIHTDLDTHSLAVRVVAKPFYALTIPIPQVY